MKATSGRSLPESPRHFCLPNNFLNAAVVCSISGTRSRADPVADKYRGLISSSPHYFSRVSPSPLVFRAYFFCLVPAMFFTYFLLPLNSCDLLLIYSFSTRLPTFCLFHHWALIGVLPPLCSLLLRAHSNSQAGLALTRKHGEQEGRSQLGGLELTM